MKHKKIPVWLLTGFLGSGKTSLLLNWLRDAALANVALVINEIGEVGVDNALVSACVDSASVLVGNCVCCTGLEGLETSMSDLWWDRLYRKRPHFDAVIIETTGLANPISIQASFQHHPLLRERYRLQATLTTISACSGIHVLNTFDEAVSQVAYADVILLTHADKQDATPVLQEVQRRNSHAICLFSSNASVSWPEIVAASQVGSIQDHPHPQSHTHQHASASQFLATPIFADAKQLNEYLKTQLKPHVIRMKGIVLLEDAKMWVVQWAVLDQLPSITPYIGAVPKSFGLTFITENHPRHRLSAID